MPPQQKPQIFNLSNARKIEIQSSFVKISKNSFSRSVLLRYYCDLEQGQYVLLPSDPFVVQAFNANTADIAEYSAANTSSHSQHQLLQLRSGLKRKQRIVMSAGFFIGLPLFFVGLFTLIDIFAGVGMEGSLFKILDIHS